jgi:hypothetical protein
VIQDFRVDVLFARLRDTSEHNINPSLAQLAVLIRDGPHRRHIDSNTSVSSTKPTEHGRDQPGNDVFVPRDTNFADSRISQELDTLYALT